MYDLIVRGGTLVDGTGRQAYTADVAIQGSDIAEVGKITATARHTFDASGLLVTPGWIDIHTHYDGQATWDPLLEPSSLHGVTTVIMGNCGVGFAPVRSGREAWLTGLMEGVEDIPGAALTAGIKWEWESFPEYLDAIETMPRAINVGCQIPHGPLRAYVMGERGAENAPSSPEEMEEMAALVDEAMLSGALGFSTNRTAVHIGVDGNQVPGTFADKEELLSICQAVTRFGTGVVEVAPSGVVGENLTAPSEEVALLKELSIETGCKITFLLGQHNSAPNQWKEMLKAAEEGNTEGACLVPQVFGRPTGFLFSFQTLNPFWRFPSFQPLMACTHEERLGILQKVEFKAQLLREEDAVADSRQEILRDPWSRTYILGDPPNYEPEPENSIAELAKRQGRNPREIAYEIMLEEEGTRFLMYCFLGYADGDLSAIQEMLVHPQTVIGGSDGGAHYRYICDGSVPTYMLSHWTRDRTRGSQLPLELIVRKQTLNNANLYGLHDRGIIEVGRKADLNIIDFQSLGISKPYLVSDLPAKQPRLMQSATGYEATIVSGKIVRSRGQDTGERPGSLIRGGAHWVQ